MAAVAEAFVPFEPGCGAGVSPSREGGDGRKGTVSGPAGLSGAPSPPSSASREAFRAFEPFQVAAPAHSHGQGAGQPVVTLQREGERVTGIRVECACGQVIELACSY